MKWCFVMLADMNEVWNFFRIGIAPFAGVPQA